MKKNKKFFSLRQAHKWGLALALFMVSAGLVAMWDPPKPIVVDHGSFKSPIFKPTREVVDQTRARLYGFGMVWFGVGLGLFSCYVPRTHRTKSEPEADDPNNISPQDVQDIRKKNTKTTKKKKDKKS